MKRIATGIPSFEELITAGDIVYVDKTRYIHNILKSADKFFFISRPRRFGKSLMCSTLDALFSGKKELFEGLYISGTDYDFKKYPVLHFDFSQMKSASYDTFLSVFQNMIRKCAAENNIKVEIADPSMMLINVLDAADHPVIIIDEFDSPMIEVVSTGDKELAEKMRSIFNSFYTIIKSYSAKIRFFFMTGCTKLSGMSIFSAMNNLNDISQDDVYADMFGYSEKELEKYFGDFIDSKFALSGNKYGSRREFLDELRSFYDGYRFSPDSEVKVYNPVSVGTYFSKNTVEFKNFWTQTGGMSTLAVTLARSADLVNIVDKDINANVDDISTFDIMTLADKSITKNSATILLYYAGYLTIAGVVDPYSVKLDFPNGEVRTTFMSQLLATYTPDRTNPMSLAYRLSVTLEKGDIRGIIDAVNDYYKIFNYTDFEKYKEQLVKILFKSYMGIYGIKVDTELPAGMGRADAVVRTAKQNYIFEFKFDRESSDDALMQIVERKYAWMFTDETRPLHLVGVDFRSKSQQIVSYTHQLYGSKDVDSAKLVD